MSWWRRGPPAADDEREAPRDPKFGRRARKLALGMVFLGGTVAALVGDKGYLDGLRLRAELARNQVSLNEQRERVTAARLAVARLKSDPWVKERLAREKLGLVAPGEVLILIADPAPGSSESPQATPPPSTEP